MDDETYKGKLIAGGVAPKHLEGCSSHDLDCIGNIMQVYRTSMAEQNPSAFRIEQFAAAYYRNKRYPGARTLEPGT